MNTYKTFAETWATTSAQHAIRLATRYHQRSGIKIESLTRGWPDAALEAFRAYTAAPRLSPEKGEAYDACVTALAQQVASTVGVKREL